MSHHLPYCHESRRPQYECLRSQDEHQVLFTWSAVLIIVFFLPVPLGSIPELPAETCQEIKMSEGGQAVSGKYWFHSIVPERTVLAPCDMKTEGEFKCLSIFPPPLGRTKTPRVIQLETVNFSQEHLVLLHPTLKFSSKSVIIVQKHLKPCRKYTMNKYT